MEYTISRINPNVNHRLWLIMICQRWFTDCNKCVTVVQDGDNGRGFVFVKADSNVNSVSLLLTFADNLQFSSVQSLRCVWLFVHYKPQHARPPCPPPTPGVYPNSCPVSWQCHPTISSSVVPFSSCPQSFPASGSFQMSQLFTSGGQSTGDSASTLVLPTNIRTDLL